MTFREKSTVAQFAAILLVYGFVAIHYWGTPLSGGRAIAVLIGITVWMILIMVLAHIAFAIQKRPENADERDAGVKVRGARNGYAVLGLGFWCILMMIVLKTPYAVLFGAALVVCALAELARLGSQLYYYRFG